MQKEMGTLATFLNQADAELKRVSHIVRRTLGLFRDGSKERVLRFDELVADVISIYPTRIQARDIALECDLSPVSVKGFEGELRQVISNLLLNALDAANASVCACAPIPLTLRASSPTRAMASRRETAAGFSSRSSRRRRMWKQA